MSTTPSYILSSPILKKQKMSITQTYYLAHKARAKLSHEAAMPDHNLRLLVGHANLLDSLMLELADAEREQESWFNQSVRTASQPEKKTTTTTTTTSADNKHIQWADTIAEEEDEDEDEEEYYDSSSDDDSDLDEDIEMADVVSLRRVPSHNGLKVMPQSPRMEIVEIDMEDDFEEDDEEDYGELTLTRTPSHLSTTTSSPPPELEHDSDESEEDEAMPPSPPSTLLPTFEQKQKDSESITTGYYDEIHYMPARNSARLVSAISVY